jgi:hypothetical protein
VSALLLALLAWIGGQTGYAVPATSEDLPAVERLDPVAMAQMVDPKAPAERLRQRTVLGAYDVRKGVNGTIYLSAGVDLADEASHEVLVHELVHFLQYRSGKSFRCFGRMEAEAYAVTRAWLAERGLPDRHDDFAIFFASKCPDEIPTHF